MIVTKENYEIWMLDYLEGRLLGKDLVIFEDFLSEHPELRENPEDFAQAKLEADDKFFPDNSLLKAKMLKQVIDEEEHTCFEAVEGTLAKDREARLEKRVLASERLKQKLGQYKEAKLMANFQVVYPDKESLKRKASAAPAQVRTLWPYMVAAAALAGIIYLVLPQDDGLDKHQRVPLSELVKKKEEKKVVPSKTVVNPVVEPKAEVKAEPVKEEVQPIQAVPPVVHKSAVKATPVLKAVPVIKTKPVIRKKELAPTKPVVPAKEPARSQEPQLAWTAEPKKEPIVIAEPKLVVTSKAPETKRGIVAEAKDLVARVDNYKPNYKKVLNKAEETGTKLLSRLTGNRLVISKDQEKGTRVEFKSKLFGFQKEIK